MEPHSVQHSVNVTATFQQELPKTPPCTALDVYVSFPQTWVSYNIVIRVFATIGGASFEVDSARVQLITDGVNQRKSGQVLAVRGYADSYRIVVDARHVAAGTLGAFNLTVGYVAYDDAAEVSPQNLARRRYGGGIPWWSTVMDSAADIGAMAGVATISYDYVSSAILYSPRVRQAMGSLVSASATWMQLHGSASAIGTVPANGTKPLAEVYVPGNGSFSLDFRDVYGARNELDGLSTPGGVVQLIASSTPCVLTLDNTIRFSCKGELWRRGVAYATNENL